MIQRRFKIHRKTNGSLVWLTTFNDMITLLMVFFVLLFTMGNLDVKRFKNFQNELQSAMGVLDAGRHAPIGTISKNDDSASDPAPNSKAKHPENHLLDTFDQTQGIEAEYTRKGIQLTLDDQLLYKTGSAELTKEGLDLLLKISAVIKPLKRNIRVEGHTDNVPIKTVVFPSNWELSIARAITVVKVFIHKGDIEPYYLSAVGYGDVKPKTDNDSPHARSKNRRVEIILGNIHEIQTLK